MSDQVIEKRLRVILYGRSLILGTVAASLHKQTQIEVVPLSPPYPDLKALIEMEPDAILFDLQTDRPESTFALLATCPGVQLIGIDPDRDLVMVWSGRQLRELSVQDLVQVIQTDIQAQSSLKE